MKYLYLLPLGLAILAVSCKNKTASTNPYEDNPYYGPSGSEYGSSTSDYSSTPSSASYPSYSESTYTPPTGTSNASAPSTGASNTAGSNQSTPASSTPLPDVPETPSYASTGSVGGSPTTYTEPAGGGSGGGSSAGSGGSSAGSHTVASGENLYRISLKHGTSVAAIKNANGMNGNTIHPGQTLRIP